MREFELHEHIYARTNRAAGGSDKRIIIPPGDDMAMLRLASGGKLLAAVDQLVDGRHVLLATTPIELVGRKAVTRSLSDIAAMAAKPLATLAAVTLPPDFGSDRATALFDAMRATAEQYDCPLVGGDIAFHPADGLPMVCSVTVFAEPAGDHEPVRRAGAKLGDVIYITGTLGGSFDKDGGGKHLTFDPRINEAIALAVQLGEHLHAMIDISDGLGRDASHIAAMSGVRIQLHADLIPCAPGIDWRRAVGEGEDYELCFAAAKDANVPQRIGEVSVTAIGEVVGVVDPQSPLVTVLDGALLVDVTHFGWEHRA